MKKGGWSKYCRMDQHQVTPHHRPGGCCPLKGAHHWGGVEGGEDGFGGLSSWLLVLLLLLILLLLLLNDEDQR